MLARPCMGVAAAVAAVRQHLLAQFCKVVLLQSSKMLSQHATFVFLLQRSADSSRLSMVKRRMQPDGPDTTAGRLQIRTAAGPSSMPTSGSFGASQGV